jgi:HEAT repeat protein
MGAPSAGLLLVLALLPARAEDAAEELLDLTYAAEAKSAAQLSPDREADWEALRAMLRGKDAKARVAAIARLGREPDTRAQPILIRHLREDKSAAVRRAAAAGLMRAQGP